MILLDQRDRRPIYEQIADKLSELMICGVLNEDEPLPSVRSLAAELSINPNTVQRSYIELERQGYIYSVKGKGSFVSGTAALREEKRRELLSELETLTQRAVSLGMDAGSLCGTITKVYEAAASGKRDNQPDAGGQNETKEKGGGKV